MARSKFNAMGRTMEILRELGYQCEVVERWIPGAGIRKDFLGAIDMMALRPGKKKIIGVQVFTTAWTEHERKICHEYPEGAKLWLGMGHELWFFGWRKLKVKRGGVAVRWTPRIGKVTLTKKGKLKLIEAKSFGGK